jgi:homoserine dehydrogenase
MKTLKLAILGYGNVGRAYGKLLTRKQNEIIERYDTKVIVTAIAAKTKGTVCSEKGIDLIKIEEDIVKYGKFQDAVNKSPMEVAETAGYDALIELTPLEIFSGQPAIGHINAAFKRGKHAYRQIKGR